jgi:hypothetical protein
MPRTPQLLCTAVVMLTHALSACCIVGLALADTAAPWCHVAHFKPDSRLQPRWTNTMNFTLNQTACSRNHVHGTNTAIEIQANNIYADSECHTRNGQYTDYGESSIKIQELLDSYTWHKHLCPLVNMAVSGASFILLQKQALHQSWGWKMGGRGGCARKSSHKRG